MQDVQKLDNRRKTVKTKKDGEKGGSSKIENIPRSEMERVVMSCSWLWRLETWREESARLPPGVRPEEGKGGEWKNE